MKLYAVDCDDKEWALLKDIDARWLIALDSFLRGVAYLEGARTIRVICTGRAARLHRLPRSLRRYVFAAKTDGAWIGLLRVAIVEMPLQHSALMRILLHELVHGILDTYCSDFAFPAGIEEGYAHLAGHLIPLRFGAERSTPCESQRWLDPAECMAVREIIYHDGPNHLDFDREAYSRLSRQGFWLNAFLAKASHRHPQLRCLLGELRRANARHPQDVYRWLLHVLQVHEDQLEDAFFRFCTGESTGWF